MRVALEEEELALIREEVLNPQARGIGMRSRLVHDGDIRASNRTIGRNDDLQIRFASQCVAEAQAKIVPEDANSNFARRHVGNVGARSSEIASRFQLLEEVNAGGDVI